MRSIIWPNSSLLLSYLLLSLRAKHSVQIYFILKPLQPLGGRTLNDLILFRMFSHVGFSLAGPLYHLYAAAAEKISVTLRDGVS